jgi:uncharacterized UBP type Zn finger protein
VAHDFRHLALYLNDLRRAETFYRGVFSMEVLFREVVTGTQMTMSESNSLGDSVRRVLFQRSLRQRDCAHISQVADVVPGAAYCRACRDEGTRTVHLRMCLACGEVGCCDSSPAKHARRHFEGTGHPLIRSIEPGERWAWCYLDKAYLSGVT